MIIDNLLWLLTSCCALGAGDIEEELNAAIADVRCPDEGRRAAGASAFATICHSLVETIEENKERGLSFAKEERLLSMAIDKLSKVFSDKGVLDGSRLEIKCAASALAGVRHPQAAAVLVHHLALADHSDEKKCLNTLPSRRAKKYEHYPCAEAYLARGKEGVEALVDRIKTSDDDVTANLAVDLIFDILVEWNESPSLILEQAWKSEKGTKAKTRLAKALEIMRRVDSE